MYLRKFYHRRRGLPTIRRSRLVDSKANHLSYELSIVIYIYDRDSATVNTACFAHVR